MTDDRLKAIRARLEAAWPDSVTNSDEYLERSTQQIDDIRWLIEQVEALKAELDYQIEQRASREEYWAQDNKTLMDANTQLKAENWVLRDKGLRTYDGLAEKADRADELARQNDIMRTALEDYAKGKNSDAVYDEFGCGCCGTEEPGTLAREALEECNDSQRA